MVILGAPLHKRRATIKSEITIIQLLRKELLRPTGKSWTEPSGTPFSFPIFSDPREISLLHLLLLSPLSDQAAPWKIPVQIRLSPSTGHLLKNLILPKQSVLLSIQKDGNTLAPSKESCMEASKYSITLVRKLSRCVVPTLHDQSSVLGSTDCPRLRSRSSIRNFKKVGNYIPMHGDRGGKP